MKRLLVVLSTLLLVILLSSCLVKEKPEVNNQMDPEFQFANNLHKLNDYRSLIDTFEFLNLKAGSITRTITADRTPFNDYLQKNGEIMTPSELYANNDKGEKKNNKPNRLSNYSGVNINDKMYFIKNEHKVFPKGADNDPDKMLKGYNDSTQFNTYFVLTPLVENANDNVDEAPYFWVQLFIYPVVPESYKYREENYVIPSNGWGLVGFVEENTNNKIKGLNFVSYYNGEYEREEVKEANSDVKVNLNSIITKNVLDNLNSFSFPNKLDDLEYTTGDSTVNWYSKTKSEIYSNDDMKYKKIESARIYFERDNNGYGKLYISDDNNGGGNYPLKLYQMFKQELNDNGDREIGEYGFIKINGSIGNKFINELEISTDNDGLNYVKKYYLWINKKDNDPISKNNMYYQEVINVKQTSTNKFEGTMTATDVVYDRTYKYNVKFYRNNLDEWKFEATDGEEVKSLDNNTKIMLVKGKGQNTIDVTFVTDYGIFEGTFDGIKFEGKYNVNGIEHDVLINLGSIKIDDKEYEIIK
ncbi:hypothetical protein [Marinitoga litoralis]|uniref:hypothetical protein n=1 Tax=Marinitoga litoralis TaxID=570855 RepID=UPI00196050EC|nr:hypothetical protein [Marinitoga litoralis]MBM7559311.1 hypothetical protein [Marinitoga litoralis]